MRILPEETGAVVIDMQEKLMMAMNETKACEEKAAMLLKGLQVLSIPTVIVQQYTKGLGHTLPSLYEAAGTTEYCEKASFSCCRNKAILDKLESMGKKNILDDGNRSTYLCSSVLYRSEGSRIPAGDGGGCSCFTAGSRQEDSH